MYMTTTNNPEPHNPTSTQYPLRPASRTSPIRINVLKSLRLHRVTAILVTLLVLGLGLAVVARHKPYYSATSTLYVSPTVPKTLTEDHELDRPYESYVQEITHDINRYDILAEAIHRMPAGLWLYPGETERSGVARLQHSLEIERVGTTYQVDVTHRTSRRYCEHHHQCLHRKGPQRGVLRQRRSSGHAEGRTQPHPK